MARAGLRGYIARLIAMAFFAIDLVRTHDEALTAWAADAASVVEAAGLLPAAGARPAGGESVLRSLVEAQHRANFTIWVLEDEARRRDVGDAYVAGLKRAIDPWNQRRNDLMERIDEAVLAALSGAELSGAELHSETAGMMVDRLSILALKIRNMESIAAAAEDHVLARECSVKAVILREQRQDLVGCLETLVEDFRAGRRCFKQYRQYKAYNDPDLNPALRRASGREHSAAASATAAADKTRELLR